MTAWVYKLVVWRNKLKSAWSKLVHFPHRSYIFVEAFYDFDIYAVKPGNKCQRRVSQKSAFKVWFVLTNHCIYLKHWPLFETRPLFWGGLWHRFESILLLVLRGYSQKSVVCFYIFGKATFNVMKFYLYYF